MHLILWKLLEYAKYAPKGDVNQERGRQTSQYKKETEGTWWRLAIHQPEREGLSQEASCVHRRKGNLCPLKQITGPRNRLLQEEEIKRKSNKSEHPEKFKQLSKSLGLVNTQKTKQIGKQTIRQLLTSWRTTCCTEIMMKSKLYYKAQLLITNIDIVI